MTSMCPAPNPSASLGLLYGGQEVGENPPIFCEAGPRWVVAPFLHCLWDREQLGAAAPDSQGRATEEARAEPPRLGLRKLPQLQQVLELIWAAVLSCPFMEVVWQVCGETVPCLGP